MNIKQLWRTIKASLEEANHCAHFLFFLWSLHLLSLFGEESQTGRTKTSWIEPFSCLCSPCWSPWRPYPLWNLHWQRKGMDNRLQPQNKPCQFLFIALLVGKKAVKLRDPPGLVFSSGLFSFFKLFYFPLWCLCAKCGGSLAHRPVFTYSLQRLILTGQLQTHSPKCVNVSNRTFCVIKRSDSSCHSSQFSYVMLFEKWVHKQDRVHEMSTSEAYGKCLNLPNLLQ